MKIGNYDILNCRNFIKAETVDVGEFVEEERSVTLPHLSNPMKEEKVEILEVFIKEEESAIPTPSSEYVNEESTIPTASNDCVNKTEYLFGENDDIQIKEEALPNTDYVSIVESNGLSCVRDLLPNKGGLPELNSKQFKCPICNKSFVRAYGLKRHEQVHTHTEESIKLQEAPYNCKLCNCKFTRYYCLQGHLKAHLPHKIVKKNNLVPESSDEKPFACQFCDYKCVLNSQLKKHMSIHGEDKPFSCEKCDYRCSRKDYLRRHASVHYDDKRFECSECNYKCSDATSIRRHSKIHSGDKPFSCHLCRYKCLTGSHLKRHMAVHTKERFFCFNCSYKTTLKLRLEKHALDCRNKISPSNKIE